MKRFAFRLGLLCVFTAPAAHASYVNTCILHGTIASSPQRATSGLWTFDFAVQAAGAARDGRVDGSCKSYEKQVPVSLALQDAKQTLTQGQAPWLRDLFKHDRDKSFHAFSLLSEKQGQSLMNPAK